MARGDFHLHSTASDGTSAPADVVALAASRGVEVLALTDHDTTAGIKAAQRAGNAAEIRVIAGIEISTDLPDGGDAHILGYFPTPANNAAVGGDAFQIQLRRYREGRQARGLTILAKLDALSLSLSWDRVLAIAGEAAVGRPHVAAAMVEAGYVETVPEAFDLYLYSGGPGDAPREKLPPPQALQLIRDAGGVPVLAHPRYLPDPEGTIASLSGHGLQGIEVYYKNHDPHDIARFDRLAKEHGLIATGGSDFHGTKADEHLPGDLPLPPDRVNTFLAFLEQEWSAYKDGVN
jgi:predicted metal-dependent phosphoesterase TrpH